MLTPTNRLVLDASVLLRIGYGLPYEDPRVRGRLRMALERGEQVILPPQALYELWVVLTRPRSANGYGEKPTEVSSFLDEARSAFTFVPDPDNLVDVWLDLCSRYGVMGKQAHDARIAAYAVAVGVPTILTLNPSDFARFDEIRVEAL